MACSGAGFGRSNAWNAGKKKHDKTLEMTPSEDTDMLRSRLARMEAEVVRLRDLLESQRQAAERTESARQEIEQGFRMLFQTMDSGFVLHEILRDAGGQPYDYRFLEVNPAFVKITGLNAEDAVGRTVLEAFPKIDPYWMECLESVANTGETAHFERFSPEQGRHYSATVYRPAPDRIAVLFVDITGHKETQEALQAALAELTAIHENAPLTMILLGEDRRVIKANAAAQFAGRTAEDMAGRQGGEALRCLHALDDPEGCGFGLSCRGCRIRQAVLDTFATGNGCQGLETWMTFQREGVAVEKCLLVSVDRIRMDGGFRVLVCAEDITERKRAEDALRDSQELYRSLVENLPQSVFRKDREGRFVFCNRRFCETVKRPLGEILGKTDFDLFPREMAEAYRADDRRVMELYETLDQIEKHIAADGSLMYVQVVKTLLRDPAGEIAGIQGIFWDVTERCRKDEELWTLARFNEEVISGAGEGIIVYDRELRYRVWNPFMEKLTGVSASAVLNRHALDMFPHLREQGVDKLLQAALNGQTVRSGDVAFTSPATGKSGWVVGIYAPHRNADGEIVGVIANIRDISDRKRIEAERLELERRLLQTQKLESLGVLAGGIAHDFNNLLMAIMGNLDLAIMDLAPDSRAYQDVEKAMAAASRAADLTRQMLAYSGKGAFMKRPMDLSELVEENTGRLRASVPKNVRITLNLAADLPRILADSGQILHVLISLFTNAAEAIGDAPGMIRISTGATTCTEQDLQGNCMDTAPACARCVFLEVSDTGCGMDEETKRRLFDPFFSTKFTGRGLGMSAVQGIVRGHNGAMFVESEPGKGTTVRILFPVMEADGDKAGCL
mgnify:CR=1 FL=1